MTNWNELLPEHEPGEGSWGKLEDSLRFERQLQRELEKLPRYQPGEESWERIAAGLSRGSLRFTWYHIAAAALLIPAVFAVLFLMQRDDMRNDLTGTKGSHELFQEKQEQRSSSFPESPPTGEAGIAVRDGKAGKDPAQFPQDKTSEPVNSPEIASKPAIRKKTDSPKPMVRKEANLIPASGSYTKLQKKGAAPETVKNTATDANADTTLLATSRVTAEKAAGGHHRVIRIQWKTPEKTRVTLARLPAETPDKKNTHENPFIKIKL